MNAPFFKKNIRTPSKSSPGRQVIDILCKNRNHICSMRRKTSTSSTPQDIGKEHSLFYQRHVLFKSLFVLALMCMIVAADDRLDVFDYFSDENAVIVYERELPGGLFFEVFEGEEPCDAAYAFALEHEIDYSFRSELISEACRHLECTRVDPLVYSKSVRIGHESDQREFTKELEIFEGEEPVDAIHNFIIDHALNDYESSKDIILSDACEYLECTRTEAAVWEKQINISGESISLVVMPGEEPSDVIFDILSPYGVSWNDRQSVMQLAIDDGVYYTRKHALIEAIPLTIMGKTFNETIDFYDDGLEPVDSLYDFILEHDLEEFTSDLIDKIMPRVCSHISCQRQIPVIWVENIVNEHGEQLGVCEIYLDEEPIDAIDAFVVRQNLSNDVRVSLYNLICQDLSCLRDVPVVYKEIVRDESNQIEIGAVEVFEGEEVVDGVVRFLQKHPHHYNAIDIIALKNYCFQNACSNPRVLCTRNYSIVFDQNIPIADNTSAQKQLQNISSLVIRDDEEPADKAYTWIIENSLEIGYYHNLVRYVCDQIEVFCSRKAPLLFGPQTISDKDGESIGVLQIEMFQEPIDAVYGFFAKHGLIEKGWDLLNVLDQLCDLPQLAGKCNRRKAIKYYNKSMRIGNVAVGEFVVWEDEEVIDKLYQLRIDFNLTLADQMESFASICEKEEVHCSRTRAIVYHIQGINWKEYDEFGNATCARHYVGWQYLASNEDSRFFKALRSLVQHRIMKKFLEHRLFGPCLLLFAFTIVKPIMRFLKWRAFSTKLNNSTILNSFEFIIVFAFAVFSASYIICVYIQPNNQIDMAMYAYEGKLPDLKIYEGDEPVDAILEWVKETSKEYHPLARGPIHDDLIREVCGSREVNCSRMRAWEPIYMGGITIRNILHNITYMNAGIDPKGTKTCPGRRSPTRCLKGKAEEVCNRVMPPLNDCVHELTIHMIKEYKRFNANRMNSKNAYVVLELELDATSNDIFYKAASLARRYKINFAPFQRVDNGTNPHNAKLYSHDKRSLRAWSVIDAYRKISDKESREWHDKPCTPMFGGALCGKKDKDGNLKIEV